MNPWKGNLLSLCRDVLRFALWLGIVLNGVMLAIFSILFTAFCLWRVWGWMYEHWFSMPW